MILNNVEDKFQFHNFILFGNQKIKCIDDHGNNKLQFKNNNEEPEQKKC